MTATTLPSLIYHLICRRRINGPGCDTWHWRRRIFPKLTICAASILSSLPLDAQQLAGRCNNIDPDLKPGIAATIAIKGDITRATTDKNSLGVGVSADYFRHPQACGPKRQQASITIDAAYDDKHPTGKPLAITRNYESTWQHLIYLPGNRFYLAGNARLLHNTDLGIYFGQRYSALFGTRFGGEAASWELFAGPAFVGQHFIQKTATTARDPSRGYAAAYVGELGSIRVAQLDSLRAVIVSHGFWITLPVEDKDPYALNTRWFASLHLPVTGRVDIIVRVVQEYLRNAPSGFESKFLNSGIGLSVAIGNK
jgi:hypothetical protein